VVAEHLLEPSSLSLANLTDARHGAFTLVRTSASLTRNSAYAKQPLRLLDPFGMQIAE
jgi:hypothetical protein